jgi:Rad3-related DNA helicase
VSAPAPVAEHAPPVAAAPLSVSVRHLCEFAAKEGDLDLRFTPSPTAQQGREGHQLVALRRGASHESEVPLSGAWQGLRVRGRADGFDAERNTLEEVKTFRGALAAMPLNHQALHWAQLKVYGWLMCESRGLERIALTLVYLDVVTQVEYPQTETFEAGALGAFFATLCARYHGWALAQQAHRLRRDQALAALAFPQDRFRPGQRDLAAGVYRAFLQSRPLVVQAPTGIGKTIGTLYPALRAMPARGTDKLFYLTAKTPGRAVALEALAQMRGGGPATAPVFPLRVLELVARDKACEHPQSACHGASCPLAAGFHDRLPAAREAAAQQAWLDRTGLRQVALAHAVCPYYLGQEMVRWSDVVVADYNYYFDRSALLHAMTVDGDWRVGLLVDEAHNLYSRACSMYSATLAQPDVLAARALVPARMRHRIDAWLREWDALQQAQAQESGADWTALAQLPEAWLRTLQQFNSAVGEHLQEHPEQAPSPLLPFYFRTLEFAALAEAFGDHALCAWDVGTEPAGRLELRTVVPGHFLAPRLRDADALVLFSATLHPLHYHIDLLGLPPDSVWQDVPSPFRPEQLQVRIVPLATGRDARVQSLDRLVATIEAQYRAAPGNYLAFFSSFDYLAMALQALQARCPGIPVWAQQRQMGEEARADFLARFEAAGQGVGFAVLGGAFGEGVDLPGRRLIGAFVATLGLPQFDALNAAICERLDTRFGRGHDYTYVLPGIQKVVQAAGRVIRTDADTGCVVLLDARYRERRYQALLPSWWQLGGT